MANKGLTKKEEFFKVLDLISTKKVKVKDCRDVSEQSLSKLRRRGIK